MKRLIVDLLIIVAGLGFVCLAAYAQELPDAPTKVCKTNTAEGKMVEIPCEDIPPFRPGLPPRIVEPPRRNPFKVFYDIHEHPKRTQVIWMISAGVAGGMIAWFTREHCDHYPPGENGVGVDCPAEYKK